MHILGHNSITCGREVNYLATGKQAWENVTCYQEWHREQL